MGPPDTPNVIPQSKAEQRRVTESVDAVSVSADVVRLRDNFTTGNRLYSAFNVTEWQSDTTGGTSSTLSGTLF